MAKKEPEQFEYRVRKTVDAFVGVEAFTQEEADEKVKDASNWVYEQDVDTPDWEIRGRA